VAIVNLQATQKDNVATVRIFGFCDEIIKQVMEKIGIKIPEYNPTTDFVVQQISLTFTNPNQQLKQTQIKKNETLPNLCLCKPENNQKSMFEDIQVKQTDQTNPDERTISPDISLKRELDLDCEEITKKRKL